MYSNRLNPIKANDKSMFVSSRVTVQPISTWQYSWQEKLAVALLGVNPSERSVTSLNSTTPCTVVRVEGV